MTDMRQHTAEGKTSAAAAAPDVEMDQLRAGTWNLLGSLLGGAPDEKILGLLRAAGQPTDAGGDALAEAWTDLRRAAEAARPDALAREYQDLFIGLGSGEVIPYASWYQTGSLMEKPLLDLRRELRALGVERQAGVNEPEDHAAAVCEVMALVIADAAVSADWQKDFHDDHVAPWMNDLFRDIREAPSAEFYQAVGALGGAFMDFERDYFAMQT